MNNISEKLFLDGVDSFNRKSFYDEFGEGSTFPQVVVDGEKLGGCVDTIKYLKEHRVIKT